MEENQQVTPPPVTPTPVPSGSGSGSKSNNTLMAVLAYFGILVIIPLVSDAKNDPFVKFHVKQGLVLLVCDFMLWFVIAPIFRYVPILIFLTAIFNFGLVILFSIGLINAFNGKMKELPVVGSFASYFKF